MGVGCGLWGWGVIGVVLCVWKGGDWELRRVCVCVVLKR